jgi:arsenate reductase (glutaredoxin)
VPGIRSHPGSVLVAMELKRSAVSLNKQSEFEGIAMDIVIYHNPDCSTSRNTIGLVGLEPHVIEYLKTPPSRTMLKSLIARMGNTVRDVIRIKGTPYQELGLDNHSLTDNQLLDAMLAHPILINRPIVVTPKGVKLCRPSEVVLDILPAEQRGEFRKEDGKLVVDSAGKRPPTKPADAARAPNP